MIMKHFYVQYLCPHSLAISSLFSTLHNLYSSMDLDSTILRTVTNILISNPIQSFLGVLKCSVSLASLVKQVEEGCADLVVGNILASYLLPRGLILYVGMLVFVC